MQTPGERTSAQQMSAHQALASGRFDEALAGFDAELAAHPHDINTGFGRATALKHLGRHEEARAGFDAILLLKPDAAGALNNRGDTLLALQRPAEALVDFERAIAAQPGMAQAHLGRGIALQRLDRLQDSLACFGQALLLWPECADAYFFAGLSLERLGRPEEALAQYDKAAALEPHSISLTGNRATVLLQLKRFAEAAIGFEKIDGMAPGNPTSLNGLAYIAAHTCDWRRWREFHDRIARQLRAGEKIIHPGALIPYSNAPDLMLAVARNVTAGLPKPQKPLWRGEPFSGPKIRLGYCSSDFHCHPTSQLMVEVWERHDRSRFDVIVFGFGPDDASPMRARVTKAFDRFHVMAGASASAIAQKIAAEGVDIAVDLNGLTDQGLPKIFASRPAPVQVNYLGYPGTMGADFMDYILADAVALPFFQQAFYPEKILHLPDCYQPNDSRRARPPAPTRAAAGLPENGFVFCCFNNSWKITPVLFDVWMRLLQAVPDSLLWLIRDNDQAAANLRRHAAERGIDEGRIVLAPRVELDAHLARHAHAGLFLDTLPYNAHTTASDALWMDVPVITCWGEGFAGRVAASLLTAIGLPELIAENLQDYEALALALARDPARLRALKDKLAANRRTTPLFDAQRFTRNLEAAYETMRDVFLAKA